MSDPLTAIERVVYSAVSKLSMACVKSIVVVHRDRRGAFLRARGKLSPCSRLFIGTTEPFLCFLQFPLRVGQLALLQDP
jgi:hypothetical protein